MNINKFGMTLDTRNDVWESYESRNREYVKNNALCLNDSYYDANLCKIKRLSSPVLDTDASNKHYVEASVQKALDHCDTRIEDIKSKIEDIKSKIDERINRKIDKYKQENRKQLDAINTKLDALTHRMKNVNNNNFQSRLRAIEDTLVKKKDEKNE